MIYNVSFCHRAKWFSYIHFFKKYFPLWLNRRTLNIVPWALQWDLVWQLTPANSTPSPSVPFLSATTKLFYSLCLWVSFCSVHRFICAIFWIPYISGIMWDLSFSFWLTSVSMILGPSMLLQMPWFHSFYGWVLFRCIYVPHLLNPFICQWTFSWVHVLALVTSAAGNIQVCVFFWVTFFSGHMPKS